MKLSEEAIKYFAKYIENEIGIVFTETNYFQLEHRLETVASALGFIDVQSFYQEARRHIHGHMKDLLLDVATNNETSFFRDAHVFRALAKKIVPELMTKYPEKKIRVWSAAGSTGQEAYSMAMSLEQERAIVGQFNYHIHVTDFSQRVLKRCKDGKYNQLEVQRGLPASLLVQYFEKTNEENYPWQIKAVLRDHMSFSQLNLLEPFPIMEQFHVIFCRNVLIYQTVEKKIEVLTKLHALLHDSGYLILGAAESLIGLSNDFTQQEVEGAVVFKRK